MSQRRLLVLDAYDVDTLQRVIGRGESWDVLLLGLNEPWFRWSVAALPSAGPNLRFVDQRLFAPDAHARVRAFVLETTGALPDLEIGGRSLRDILQQELHTNWWYTETSEKGPYRTPLVFQLHQLAMIDLVASACQYAEVLVAARQEWLRRVAAPNWTRLPAGSATGTAASPASRYVRHAAASVVSALVIRAAATASRWPRVVPSGTDPSVFTFFPAWWTNASHATATERFFSSPPRETSYFGWLHKPVWVWRFRHSIADTIAARRIVVLQRFVPLRQVFEALSPVTFWRTMGFLRRVRTMASMRFAGVDVAPLVAADLERSLTSGERFQDPLIEAAIRNAAGRFGTRRVMYRAEFQPAERAVVTGLSGMSQTVGFVHYMFGRNYLPIWDTSGPRSASTQTGVSREQPMPDGMMTCGAVGRGHLVERGYPADRIALCGPQRHATLLERLAGRRDRASLRRAFGAEDQVPLLLVTPAIVEADTEALFGTLMRALGGYGPFRLLVRAHPNRAEGGPAVARAVSYFGHARASMVPQDVPLYDAIEASDALITIGSTVAFEAMALGCMPIVFENPATYAATSLAAFDNALYVVRNEEELRIALDELRSASANAQRRRAAWATTIEQTLGDLRTPVSVQLTSALGVLDRAFAG